MELGSGIRSPLEAGDWEGIGDLIPSRGKGSGIGSMGQKLDHDPQSGIIGSLASGPRKAVRGLEIGEI